jgi:hypothetical protein
VGQLHVADLGQFLTAGDINMLNRDKHRTYHPLGLERYAKAVEQGCFETTAIALIGRRPKDDS